MRKSTLALTLALALLLALSACHMAAVPTGEPVAVGLVAPDLLRPAEVTTLGVPTLSGQTAVEYLHVFVYTADGTPVTFDDDYNMMISGGTRDRVMLDGSQPSTEIFLRPGKYDFEAKGFDGSLVPQLLAYRLIEDHTITAETAVNLPLETIIDSVIIEPATPIEFVVPGQTLDLLITVFAPPGEVGVPVVPLADFAPTYDFLEGGVETGVGLASSVLGVRVQVDESGEVGTFTANVEVAGNVNNGGAVEAGSRRASRSFPFTIHSGIFSDLESPQVTFQLPELYASSEGELEGTAHDEIGIRKLQVFEGPVLIGSSDSDEFEQAAVEEVTFSGTTWTLPHTPSVAGDASYTAVAFDATGNTSQVTRAVEVGDGPLFTYFLDEDGDGYGGTQHSVASPSDHPPAGYSDNARDCNDSVAAINPGTMEIVGNGIDDDCNGEIQ